MKRLGIIILLLSISSIISQSPDQLYHELFEAVQMQRVFNDSKTFCDVIPRNQTPNEILDLYRKEFSKPTFNLTSFVLVHDIIVNHYLMLMYQNHVVHLVRVIHHEILL